VSPKISSVAIIGVGLIGGSFGMALRKRGLAKRVVGIGRNPERLQRAVDLGAVDEYSTDLEAAAEADFIYVSTPVGMELDFIRQVIPLAKPDCVITDAGSTKAEICRGVDALLRDGISFVGAHPMAGSEATGVEAANPDLFVNATYVLTPTEQTDSHALSLVKDLAEGVGARVIVMDPEAHDRCAAVISHLPHLIAAALVALTREHSQTDPQVFDLIAGSFRDMTRVAGSSPVLWRDICLTNPESIRAAADSFHRLLEEAVGLVESRDGKACEDWFESAKQTKDRLIPPR
jgi:prephenate dehydrogenase